MRRAPHQHDFLYAESESRHVLLRDIRKPSRALVRRKRTERIAVDTDLAILRRQQAEQRAKQRRLSGAVSAEHRERFSAGKRERHIAADTPRTEAEREIANLEHLNKFCASARAAQ